MKTVVIAGAGIIGLAAALELAARGLRVTVLERGRVLEEASWAAAGMLAAHDPENPAALGAFARYSVALYPAFLESLERLSACAIPLRSRETVQICESTLHGTGALTAGEAMRRLPGLRMHGGQGALWLQEASLDPRDLGRALAGAARAAGIEIREETPLLSADAHGEGLMLAVPGASLLADRLVVATGAWSAVPAESSLHRLPPGMVFPRKGQMLRLREPAGCSLALVLRSRTIYIVPRGDGSLVVGATVEDAGHDRTVRGQATEWLLGQARLLWEPLQDVSLDQVEEVWTGIRPATPDGLPVLGTVQHPRVFFATGHYRNGILLAPGTARLVAQMMSGEQPSLDPGPFSPLRLAPTLSIAG